MMDIKSVMVEEEEMTPSKVNEYAKPSLPSPPSLSLSVYPTNLPFLIIPRPLSLSFCFLFAHSFTHPYPSSSLLSTLPVTLLTDSFIHSLTQPSSLLCSLPFTLLTHSLTHSLTNLDAWAVLLSSIRKDLLFCASACAPDLTATAADEFTSTHTHTRTRMHTHTQIYTHAITNKKRKKRQIRQDKMR